MALDNFKNFVKNKPGLAKYVNSGEKTWQDFYNMYELYGENSEVWNDFIKTGVSTSNPLTIKDLFNMFKEVDISQVQESITSIQKGIGYVENLVKSKEEASIPKRSSYEARPMYKYFDD